MFRPFLIFIALVVSLPWVKVEPVQAQAELRTDIAISGAGYNVHQYAGVLRSPRPDDRGSLLDGWFPKSELAYLRSATVQAAFAKVEMTYPSSFTATIGNDPRRELEHAVEEVAEALARLQAPPEAFKPQVTWNIIVLDSVPDSANYGLLSSSLCHTAWSGPPSNIVVAADRLTRHCGRVQEKAGASSAFREVLIHEMAHVLEFQLMGRAFSRRQRWHGEGFAMWFEDVVHEASTDSSFRAEALDRKARAERVFSASWTKYEFSGSTQDYLNSYVRIAALANNYPRMPFSIYARMDRENCPFDHALNLELGLSDEAWNEQTAEFIQLR